MIAVATNTSQQQNSDGRIKHFINVIWIFSQKLRHSAKPKIVSAYVSLRSADKSQRLFNRESIENQDSRPVNLLFDCMLTYIER